MIRRIEALNYRCLRFIRQPLDRFHVLVGPNASGKTTFLDVVAFLGDLISDGLDAALDSRTNNFQDLVWGRQGDWFELAIEAEIPEVWARSFSGKFDTIRYEIKIGQNLDDNEVGILEERVVLKTWKDDCNRQRMLFPMEPDAPDSIVSHGGRAGEQTVASKHRQQNDNFYTEVRDSGKGWVPSFRLGPKRSTLANIPEDESKFPASTWLKRFLEMGIETFVLNSQVLRKASAPGQGRSFKTDGSNLSWVVQALKEKHPKLFRDWIAHLRTALPDLHDIQTVEIPDTKHRYLRICYTGGLEVPSWMVSDGTLRLLALTLPAYLAGINGAYLIEEPENGIHPGAVETVFQSLSSVYDAQILLATHSPVILSQATPEQVLCFKKTEGGATDVVSGSSHPQLRDWRGQPHLDVMFASGVLG